MFNLFIPSFNSNLNCNNHNKLELLEEESAFSDWRKLKAQKNPNDILTGSMSRKSAKADKKRSGQKRRTKSNMCYFLS